MVMASGAIANGTYWFNCTVSKTSAAAVSISSQVTIVSNPVPSVTVASPAGTKFNSGNVLALSGNATGSGVEFLWSAWPAIDMDSSTVGTTTSTSDLYLLPHTLDVDTTYTFTLRANSASNSSADDGVASATVVVNSAPVAGTISVSPDAGSIVSMSDIVLFSASSFADTERPLEYQFEYELDGTRYMLRPYSSDPTYSTRYLPEGTITPIIKVKDAIDESRQVVLGCDSFLLNGTWATDAAQCSTKNPIQISRIAVGAADTVADILSVELAQFDASSHSASTVLNFLGAGVVGLNVNNASNSTSDESLRLAALRILNDTATRANPEAASAVLLAVAANSVTLQHSSVRDELDRLTDVMLEAAQVNGLVQKAGTNMLAVITTSVIAARSMNSTGVAKGSNVTRRIEQLSKVTLAFHLIAASCMSGIPVEGVCLYWHEHLWCVVGNGIACGCECTRTAGGI